MSTDPTPPRPDAPPPRPDAPSPSAPELGDMPSEEFRAHGRRVVDWIADYLDGVGDLPVVAGVRPGEVAARLPDVPPDTGTSMDRILDDVDAHLLDGITHWNHPAFHAYFAITGSGPGILGEALTAALNVNGMLWKTSPAATELEQVTLDWLRQLLGLPDGLHGVIMDTASIATMTALAAAREAAGLDVRERGLAGRDDLPGLRVYTSEQAHSSVAKGAITVGLGVRGVRMIPTDDAFRLRPDALESAIEEDLAAGVRPLAIVATTGTTSTTSVDPVPAIADVRDRFRDAAPGLWLHVDGAYGGAAAVCPEHRWVLEGVDRADSFVVNPHKWLFTPIDCTAFYVRDPATLTRAFSLVPEYLRTAEQDEVTDYMDWGVQLGRRFRALKLWMVLRYFGRDGLARRIAHHIEQAQRVARWVEGHPLVELAAPTPLSTVCLRLVADGSDTAATEAADERARRAMDAVNASGEAYLSHTVLRGRFVLRLALGNLRTTDERLDRTLDVLDRELRRA